MSVLFSLVDDAATAAMLPPLDQLCFDVGTKLERFTVFKQFVVWQEAQEMPG